MFKKLALVAALAAALGSAQAAPTITNADGTFSFGGFDWASTASVWVRDYDIVSGGTGRTGETDIFTLNYQAYAVNVQDAGGANLPLAGLKNTDIAGGYEYTINATITESVTCLNDNCSFVAINIVGGAWDVYYDTTGDAVLGAAGISGILDGTNILSGVFTSGQTMLGPQGANNPGNVTLAGTFEGAVTFTDTTFINPVLNGTEAVGMDPSDELRRSGRRRCGHQHRLRRPGGCQPGVRRTAGAGLAGPGRSGAVRDRCCSPPPRLKSL
jgi:hypothetical protein